MGPIGSAKTTTSIYKLLELMTQQRPNKFGERKSRWTAVRNTYPDLINTTIRDFREIVEPLKLGTLTMGHPPEMKMDFDLPDGTRVISTVIFFALDKDEHVRKLRGFQATGAWLNEMKELPKSIFDMLLGRVDRYPKPGASTWCGVFGDSNAWDQDHWLNKIYEAWKLDPDGEWKDYEFFMQPGAVRLEDGKWVLNADRENKVFATEEYYLRQIPGKRPDWIKVNLANEIGYYVDGRAVHPEYSDSYHTAREIIVPTEGLLCNVGCDFGLTPAALFTQRQRDGQWRVFDEIVTEDGDAALLAGEIKARVAFWQNKVKNLSWVVRGDPSGDNRAQTDSQTAFATMRANGVMALPCSTNDPALRRAALDRPLTRTIQGRPGFLVSPSCTMFRKGMAGGFNYKRVNISAGEEKYRDVPDKNIFSHICEAGEYALLDAGEHAVINPATPTGPKPRPTVNRATWSPLDV